MQLLISVRSTAEVGAALDGGADIIDAKEPVHGSLGAVPLPVLARIMARVPAGEQLSIAMGDLRAPNTVRAAISALPAPPSASGVYLKFGFAGVDSPRKIRTLLATAATASQSVESRPLVVAVAYADAAPAGTAPPEDVVEAAAEAGARGVLLDTYRKDGRNLLDSLGLSRLEQCLRAARLAGLTTAAAGSLGPGNLAQLPAQDIDILGFRGAACAGGRNGRLDRDRVHALRQALDRQFGLSSGHFRLLGRELGETPDDRRNPLRSKGANPLRINNKRSHSRA